MSLSDVTGKCRVALDASKEKAFRVCFPDKIATFKKLDNNLWGLDPNDKNSYEDYPADNKRVKFKLDDKRSNKNNLKTSFLQKACNFYHLQSKLWEIIQHIHLRLKRRRLNQLEEHVKQLEHPV